MINLNLNTFTRWGLGAVALLGLSALLRLGEWFFIPVTMAVLLAALLWPVVRWLNERLRVPWSLACLAVVVGLVLVNLALTLGFALAIPRMLQDLPDLRTDAGQKRLYTMVRNQVERISPMLIDEEYWPVEAGDSRIFNYVQESLSKGTYVAEALLRFGYYVNNWLWQWILILFILLFLLLEGRMLTRRLVEVAGASPEIRQKAADALAEMASQVRNYIWWRTVINVGLALAVGTFYQYMGLKQAWTWALLTGVLCYVPYLGPIVAGAPPIVEAFLTFEHPGHAVVILIVYVAMIALEGYFFFPLLIGRGMELNATTVMLACLFWELVWGLPGLFLAMPLMAAIKAICSQMPDLKPWANLMSISDLDPADADPPAPQPVPEPALTMPASSNGPPRPEPAERSEKVAE